MASSRALRKSSRMASPMDVPVKESLPSNGGVSNEDSASFEEWKEPPLRAPAPSFEDYKGLERQGVLKHMAPLGSLPNQKVKLRLKAYDTSRQSLHARNGEVTPPKEEITQPNPLLPSVTRRSEPRKVEDRPLKLRSSRERDDDQDYTPKGVTKTTPAKASPSQTVLLSTPSCRTSAGQARLRNVVKSAVERSNEIGNPILGLAVKKLFEESLQNRMLADLLDAVLSQRPTPRQAADFQGYIRVARKQIKAENSSRRHSSNGVGTLSESTSTSPTKSARPSVARQIGITKDLSDTTGPNKIQGVRSSSTKQPSKNMEDNNHVAKEERPAKRRKRSRSASTSSSLSSLPSTEDRDFSPTLDANLPSGSEASPLAQAPNSAVTQSSLQEPRLHTFLTTKTTSLPNKRPAPVANLDEPAEQLTAKRQKLQQTFEDYTIKDSGIRAAPAPKKPAQIPTPPTIVMSTRAQQPRLRNGTSHRSRRDEHDELRSPSCSTQGELLIPPPAGAQSSSRGVTPSHLGRPLLKHPKKAARVKMSPIKGKTGVIAGIARTGGGRDASVGNTEGNEASPGDNSDFCACCGGHGELLCCDGCPLSFHFTCTDPPQDTANPPEKEWYCSHCRAKRAPSPKYAPGIFCALKTEMHSKDTVSYILPFDVRDYFHGVKTGEEGEYEEEVTTKTKTKAGYEEVSNNFKLKDNKDNTILCTYCGLSALGGREIIQCSICPAYWHLDCLNPPLAIAPRKSWKCPYHIEIESVIAGPDTANKPFEDGPPNRKRKTTSEGDHPAPKRVKVRRPKKFRIVHPKFPRGFENSGHIEIDDSEGENAEAGTGVIYSLPEYAIKLDFIDRVKRDRMEMAMFEKLRTSKRQREHANLESRRRADEKAEKEQFDQAQQEAFSERSLIDREAALNLTQLAQESPEIGLRADQVQNLINTLIAEAPADVVGLLPNGTVSGAGKLLAPPKSSACSISEVEKQSLLMLQELIKRRLGGA